MPSGFDQMEGLMGGGGAPMEAAFWGAVLAPGASLRVDVDKSDSEYVHVTQVALGADAKPGRTALSLSMIDEEEGEGKSIGKKGAKVDKAAHVLCTLDKGKCDQASLELVVDASFVLRNHGPNALHLTGLRQADGIDMAGEASEIERLAARQALEDSEDDEDEDDDEDFDEEEEEDDDEEE
eukprot:CAMPEP_0197594358 /NCGR_PEP_ID=MMETSP1326-20131121/20380_1 /TAXON_ID=1155430 /ORGANISM="Genus nov. species nov., Strain RCC2288" /LENGTH=180 /DNA_ID=CAMNT_0043160519 /DNA_START=122 /DNA_END=661 /DNA_ORIENTATION=+